jgi:hypothetical protein
MIVMFENIDISQSEPIKWSEPDTTLENIIFNYIYTEDMKPYIFPHER